MKKWIKSKKKPIFNLLFFGSLLTVTFFFILKDNELSALKEAVSQINGFWLLAGFGAMVLFFALEAVNLKVLVKAFGYDAGFGRCMKFALIDFYFSAITPGASGGQPAQICYMKKDGIEVGSSSLTLLMFNFTYHISLLVISGMALLAHGRELFEILPILKYLAVFGLLVQLGLSGIFIAAILRGDWLQKAANKAVRGLARLAIIKRPEKMLRKVEEQISEYREGAVHIRKNPILFLKVLLITLIHLLVFYTIPFWVYKAFGLSGVSLIGMIAFQSVFALCIECLPLPGGVGVAEKGFLLLYGSIFGSAILLPAMLLCRGINYYGFLIIGSIVTVIAHLKPARKITASRPVSRSKPLKKEGIPDTIKI